LKNSINSKFDCGQLEKFSDLIELAMDAHNWLFGEVFKFHGKITLITSELVFGRAVIGAIAFYKFKNPFRTDLETLH